METRRSVRPVFDALFIAGGYAVTAAGWRLLSNASRCPRVVRRWRLTASELAFVVSTTGILYTVTNRYLERLQESETQYREAQAALRQKDLAIRQGYVDVLDAVTGGKLILLTEDELAAALGDLIGGPVSFHDAQGLSAARSRIKELVAGRSLRDCGALILAVSEALTNAVKHGRPGEYAVYESGNCIQVVVRDFGPGIDFRALPKATLIQGFSTTNTMGLGFTIMLEVADRVLLQTSSAGTVVVLEVECATLAAEGQHRSLAEILA